MPRSIANIGVSRVQFKENRMCAASRGCQPSRRRSRVASKRRNPAPMHRLFVALRPPQPIRDRLIDLMDDSPALRWVAEENLHVTLRFLGEVERPQAEHIAAALTRVRSDSFEFRLKGVGCFDRKDGGALWIGVAERAPVAALAAKVDRACVAAGLAPERRAFHPHVTLARFGRGAQAAAEAFVERNQPVDLPTFTVDRFSLFESRLSRHGATYEEVANYALR